VSGSSVDLTVVIPAYNEEANVDRVYARLRDVLDGLGLRWELIFSVDPSTDRTEELILALNKADPRVKLLRFSRRFGQPMAERLIRPAEIGSHRDETVRTPDDTGHGHADADLRPARRSPRPDGRGELGQVVDDRNE